MRTLRRMLVSVGGTVLVLMMGTVQAQETLKTVKVTDNDRLMASLATNAKHHARRASTGTGREARRSELSNMHSAVLLTPPPADPVSNTGGPRAPGDLDYHGGAVVTSMRSHLIYVNLPSSTACSTVATCWGNPHGFLRDYGQSNMIHIVDQYTNAAGNGRYTVSEHSVEVNYPDPQDPRNPYTDNDILNIVHAVVIARGEDDGVATGYDNQYHVFLVPGQDECFDSTFTVCYSPDNANSFAFCAYHGSADFQDIGHVLYSVEPFVNVPGCSVRPDAPNGQLIDSTNNTLSHELTETITDPDGTAWYNTDDVGFSGQEIGDECSFDERFPDAHGVVSNYFDPSNVTLNGKAYAIQPEYNNAQGLCTTTP